MTRTKHLCMLWMLLVMGYATAFSFNYQKAFGADWAAAESYVAKHHDKWKHTFDLFRVNARMAEAVVFPELIRYSIWQDEIERAAVNGLYINGGKRMADFSIGRFQMKPSFAEEVEREWNQSTLARDYGFVFDTRDHSSARRSRISRLSTEEGQCRYLAIFILLLQERHPCLNKLPERKRVRYLATAYNHSFTASWSEVCSMQHKSSFHTDILKTTGTHLYCYADISVCFYRLRY